ncbi:RagB/SusD family nutrient uptake outer membrane protein [Hoylesella buccalis]|uniref:RagB/SusD family nutrient uptake outer membrane protein n=1 Tax=Hoylesella buccalis TaxID=28127 RepID=UPI0026F25BFF|nr:RagB/SusD family nutrient uptake outer membrane protein [Hoylesella buccalis]
MKKIFYYLYAACITLSICGCEDRLDIPNPNKKTSETFWKTEKDFNEALVSCYTPLKNWNGGYYGTRGFMVRISRADDIIFRNDIQDIYAMHRFTNDANNAVGQNLFYQFYNAIYRANSILQNITAKDFPKEYKDKVCGEASFIRALYYFQLGKEFGDVPLRLKASQDPATFQLKKSSQKDIYAQAEKDFLFAVDLLPLKNEIGKPTKGTAYAFLGKLYVYQERWKDALVVLKPLLSEPYKYKLMDDYSWNFDEEHEHNAESIFEIEYDAAGGSDQWDNGETANSAQSTTIAVEYAAGEVGGWFEANVSPKMMDIFMKEKAANGDFDYRLKCSVAFNYKGCMYYQKPFLDVFKNNPEGMNSFWILKYQNSKTRKQEVETLPSYINQRVMRFADVILLLAECELNLDNIHESVKYINMIRMRGNNLTPYKGNTDKQSVKQELIHQRAIEFFHEGERFYDLRRWGLLEEELEKQDKARFANFNKRHYYLPIPSKEIQTNLLCTQNDNR